jgi:hypothetical protein
MKVKFERKAYKEQILPTDEFKVEKVVEISLKQFDKFINRMLDDYDFIEANKDLMYIDEHEIWYCIFITTEKIDYGILVQSEGYTFARYSAHLTKAELEVHYNGK